MTVQSTLIVVIYIFKIDYVNMYLGERSYYECKRRGKVNSSIKRKYEVEGRKYKTGGKNM